MKSLLVLLAGTALAAGIATPVQAMPGPPLPEPPPSAGSASGAINQSSSSVYAPAASGETGRVRAMVLTYTVGESLDPLPDAYAFLNCAPVGGSHTRAKEACAALEKVQGDPAALRPRRGANCPMVFSPITVTANGIWNGRFISYRRVFGNKCEMRSIEGDVFTM